MIQIYHNNRCRKSREGLEFLRTLTSDFETIDYLNNPPTFNELKGILRKLDMKAMELVRTNEDTWKSDYKGKNLSEDELIHAMITHPKLIERPIIINGDKGVLARPAENIKKLF